MQMRKREAAALSPYLVLGHCVAACLERRVVAAMDGEKHQGLCLPVLRGREGKPQLWTVFMLLGC